MSSTIRTTIESTVGTIPSGYQSVVDRVVVAVEGLAAQAADSLRESGRSLGASSEQIESALVAAGLVEPEPVVEASSTEDISDLRRKVNALCDLARTRLGVNI